MIAIVNEPISEYGEASWQANLKLFSFEESICGIENGTILYCQPGNRLGIKYHQIPKKKLSSLRGKLSKQSNKEIDDQISKLRHEWERPI